MMNILTGGTIWQDVSEMPSVPNPHTKIDVFMRQTHPVSLAPGSRLQTLLNAETVYTNSHHHQAVNVPGKGFTVTAASADGVVEAIEHENGIWMGIQWHPERMVDDVPEMNALFRDLVEKASK